MNDEAKRDPEKLRQKLREFVGQFPFFQLIGLELCDVKPKWAKTQLVVRPELHNPSGVIHGGVIATLIDTTIAQSILMTDEYQAARESRGTLSTIDLHVKYLRPASAGTLSCEAEVVHLGKRVIHARAVLRDENGKDLAIGDATLMIVLGRG
jgi:uncharacterized protein (TIGR00369 family)